MTVALNIRNMPNGFTRRFEDSITRRLPRQVVNPSPIDGAINQRLDATISWDAIPGATYDVYFNIRGSSDIYPPEDFIGNQAGTSYDPGPLFESENLGYNTTYHWRIDTVADNGTTRGAVYSFRTAEVGVGEVFVQGMNKLVWTFTVAATAADGADGLEVFVDGAWKTPLDMELDGLSVIATYDTSALAEGDSWRINTAPAGLTFTGGALLAVPLSGETIT